MKILWATPFCQQSAIARFSAEVVAELCARGHAVAVYRTETGEATSFPAIAGAHLLAPNSHELEDWIRSADVVIANIGDHYGFHGRVFDLFEARSVIGIMHDWCLLGLFWGWLVERSSTDRAGELIERQYDAEARRAFELSTADTMLRSAAALFPMTEWLSGHLLGAVIHSRFYQRRVEAGCAGPVSYIPLAYPAPNLPKRSMPTRPAESRTIQVRTFGVVNSNKCVDRVLEAIGGDEWLREHVDYRVLGRVTDEERVRLEQIAGRLGYGGFILEGAVTQERLLAGLAEADIIFCLRSPALEGASASAIEGMQSGAPVVVNDTGFYADLPDEYVVKVSEDASAGELRECLRRLANDPVGCHKKGDAARSWALLEFSAAAYATRIEGCLPDFIAAEPYVLLANALGKELGRMGLEGSDMAVTRINQVLSETFSLP